MVIYGWFARSPSKREIKLLTKHAPERTSVGVVWVIAHVGLKRKLNNVRFVYAGCGVYALSGLRSVPVGMIRRVSVASGNEYPMHQLLISEQPQRFIRVAHQQALVCW